MKEISSEVMMCDFLTDYGLIVTHDVVNIHNYLKLVSAISLKLKIHQV